MRTIIEKPNITRKPTVSKSVKIIVSRGFIGEKPLADLIIPVIMEDFRRKAEALRTFAEEPDTQ